MSNKDKKSYWNPNMIVVMVPIEVQMNNDDVVSWDNPTRDDIKNAIKYSERHVEKCYE
jgi:hypothetical protein